MRGIATLRWLVLLLLLAGATSRPAAAQGGTLQSRYFTSSDGVRLHYLQAGPRNARALVFVPGWTMPAWIWAPQLAAFSRQYRVVAFDPRGQGDSAVPAWGYQQDRRGQDIAELIAQLGPQPVVVVGWSLGVLDTLAYVHSHGDAHLAGLVLVDNSVGEEPAPAWTPPKPHPGPPPSHALAMRRFVQAMFHHPQPASYLERLTEATLHTPEAAGRELLSYPVPRSYWRAAILSTARPVLYVVRPGWLAEQAANLQRDRPNTETAVFPDAGHALFIDDAARFNALVAGFLRQRVWP